METLDAPSQEPAMRQFLMSIAEAGGAWEGYATDETFTGLRDRAERLQLIEIAPAGGGFDYAEKHRLLPKGYAYLGLPVPQPSRSSIRRFLSGLSAALHGSAR